MQQQFVPMEETLSVYLQAAPLENTSDMAERVESEENIELADLLPQFKATEVNLLAARHRKILNRYLRIEASSLQQEAPVEFTLAILKAYEQVGDIKAVPFVKTLAHRKAWGARQKRIQEAALDCLPLLQAHTGAVSENQTLLRAADKDSATSKILLRPVSETAVSNPAQLLRATHSDPD